MRLLAKLLLLVFSAAAVTACGDDVISWRQKLTITVDTPQGPRSGSAVTEVFVDVTRSTGGLFAPQFKVSGEAVIVDLGLGKYLLALLSDVAPSETARMAEAAFGKTEWIGRTANSREEVRAYFNEVRNFRGSRELAPFYWPVLVTFNRADDSATLTLVNPRNTYAALGSGYKLKSMTLAMTDEHPSPGQVGKLLPWFSAAPPNLIENASVAGRLPGISKASFVRE